MGTDGIVKRLISLLIYLLLESEVIYMAYYGNNIGVVPLVDAGGITQEFKAGKHYGIDIGYSSVAKDPNCKVLAWQDGYVVDYGYGSEVGNFIVLQHDYDTGHRWTGYIHLKDKPNVTKGQKFKLGEPMGNARRGNTGQSGGTHLHFYLTKIVPKLTKYTWGAMKSNCIDPKPYLYYSKEYNTEYISPSWTKELPKPIEPVTPPVERDIYKDQLTCHVDNLRVRKSASLSGEKIGHLEKDKFYNWSATQNADGYEWYQIAEAQWCAKIEELEILPAQAPKFPIGTKVIINGPLYKSSNAATASGTVVNKTTNITRFAAGAKHPYNTTGDIGWMDEVNIKEAPKEEYYIIAEGDTLESIAAKKQITLEELCNLNPQLISVGMKLRVK